MSGHDDWVIAIPTYRRATTLRDKTLRVLTEYGIAVDRIHLFVATPEEEQTYRQTLDPTAYGHIHVALPGIVHVRNAITNFFPVGQRIFSLDDDIKGFIQYDSTARRSERRVDDLSAVITEGFRAADEAGARLWGMYPVPNGFFMRDGATTTLAFIPGGAYGIVNPGSVLRVMFDDREDYVRTLIMYLLDGAVLRYRKYACQTIVYAGAGGMNDESRTLQRLHDSAVALTNMFPELVSLNTTRKSGKTEVRIRDKRKVKTRLQPDEIRTIVEAQYGVGTQSGVGQAAVPAAQTCTTESPSV
jgi:hypothetical protein